MSHVPQMRTDFRAYSNIARNRILSTSAALPPPERSEWRRIITRACKRNSSGSTIYHIVLSCFWCIESGLNDFVTENCLFSNVVHHRSSPVHGRRLSGNVPVAWMTENGRGYVVMHIYWRGENDNLTVIDHNGNIVSRIDPNDRCIYYA